MAVAPPSPSPRAVSALRGAPRSGRVCARVCVDVRAAPTCMRPRNRRLPVNAATMGCTREFCTAEKIFIFINIAFAMYAGALLATAARLAWDPSTYTWFRFLAAAQYRVSAAYVLAAGLWLVALVYLAAATRCLHLYAAGVACLGVSEVGYGAWMSVSLAEWWRSAPQAELARRGMDLMHDLKPALLAFTRYKDLVRPLYDIIEEMEREAPNNAFVIIVFGIVGAALQVAAFVMARILARRASEAAPPPGDTDLAAPALDEPDDVTAHDDAAHATHKPHATHAKHWRKDANLRMYTILDKIF